MPCLFNHYWSCIWYDVSCFILNKQLSIAYIISIINIANEIDNIIYDAFTYSFIVYNIVSVTSSAPIHINNIVNAVVKSNAMVITKHASCNSCIVFSLKQTMSLYLYIKYRAIQFIHFYP